MPEHEQPQLGVKVQGHSNGEAKRDKTVSAFYLYLRVFIFQIEEEKLFACKTKLQVMNVRMFYFHCL